MKNLASFLAWRYITFKQKDKNISFMIKVCFLGILIGTFSLMLTLIITNGFEKVVHEKMQGINAQAIVTPPMGKQLDYHSIRTTLEQELGTHIKGISGSSTRQAILQKDKTQTVMMMKGVDELREHSVTVLTDKVIAPRAPTAQRATLLQDLLIDNAVIIGQKTAINFGFKIGDTIELLIPEPTSKRRIALRKKKVLVAGIFKIGLEEYDNNFVFCSLEFLQDTFEENGVDQISLTFHDNTQQSPVELYIKYGLSKPFFAGMYYTIKNRVKQFFSGTTHEDKMLFLLRKRLANLDIYSWKDLYPALVSSLKLEKYVMFFVLALITLVASMNMISLLFMQIQHKQGDIAILKAMGTPNRIIRSIFLRLGLTITFLASSLGLLLAALAGFILEQYPFIEIPDVYYVSYLPARMDLEIFLVVFIATMLLGFLATYVPAQRSKKIKIAQVLRQE